MSRQKSSTVPMCKSSAKIAAVNLSVGAHDDQYSHCFWCFDLPYRCIWSATPAIQSAKRLREKTNGDNKNCEFVAFYVQLDEERRFCEHRINNN
mmetsp:Transcript_49/g.117  ORF Transcript_49/g.117 Transcript_49/m.117 type:complete len:94 (+) Transcript_49:410-691(+)